MDLLIVVDMQNDFVDGVLGTPETQAIVPKVRKKVEEWDGLVMFTADVHSHFNYSRSQEGKKIKEHCIESTHGAEIVGGLSLYSNIYVKKETFAPVEYFYEVSEEKKYLDIDSFTIVGLVTNICVVSTALLLRSLFPETPIIVDASCCAGTTPELHKAALKVMESCIIEVINNEL